MKRIYNLAAALLLSSSMFAQHAYDPTMAPRHFDSEDFNGQYEKLLKEKEAYNKAQMSNKAGFDKIRVSHADERSNEYLGTTSGYNAPVLPDSLAMETFTSGTRGVQIHAVGAIFDPTSFDFVKNDQGVSSIDTYTVDSIHIFYRYTIINPGSIDTLRFHLFKSDSTTGSPAYGALTLNSTTPYPDGRLRAIRFTSNGSHGLQAAPSAPNAVIFDKIMAPSDSSSTYDYMSIPVGMEVTPGNLFGFYVEYIPGAPWSAADTYWPPSSATMNVFAVGGIQEATGANDLFAFDPSSFGSTHTMFNAGRYQISATTFVNEMITPGLAGTNLVDFTYSAGVVTIGSEELNPSNVVVANNFPNPFNTNTTINYSVKKNSNIQVEVTDITGKVVLSRNEGFKTKGAYKVQLDANDFESGIYFYSIISETGTITNKMTVVK